MAERRVGRTLKWRNRCLTNSKSRKGGRKSELYNIQVVMMQPAIFILLISRKGGLIDPSREDDTIDETWVRPVGMGELYERLVSDENLMVQKL